MIYVAKILPALLLPVGVVIILLAAGLIFRRRGLLLSGLVVLWSASTPLVGDLTMRAAEGWQVPVDVASVPAADAIVVLTGMLQRAPGPREVYEWGGGVDRFEAGMALHRAGKAQTVIIPGGWVPWRPDSRPEGEVLAEKAVALGVPQDHIVVTERVSNTAGEAAAVAGWLARGGATRHTIILVTSAFHMRRARLIFEHAGLTVVPYPVDFHASDSPVGVLDALPTAEALLDTQTALRELYGYWYYRVKP